MGESLARHLALGGGGTLQAGRSRESLSCSQGAEQHHNNQTALLGLPTPTAAGMYEYHYELAATSFTINMQLPTDSLRMQSHTCTPDTAAADMY